MSISFNAPATTQMTNVIGAPLAIATTVFAKLPNPIGISGQIWQVTDIGTNGSLWVADGTSWFPLNGVVNLYENSYTFVLPPSGTITAVTGVLTLGTALDQIYSSCYMYFPAGAWTGSAAGFYYVIMTSTTVGKVYQNRYLTGIPSTPATLNLVTTGLGAYTQTSATYLTGQTFSVPGNLMGTNGRLVTEIVCSTNASANFKYVQLVYGATTFPGLGLTSATVASILCSTVNKNSTGSQASFIYNGINQGSTGLSTNDTTVAQPISINYYLATATDWIAFQWINLQVTQ